MPENRRTKPKRAGISQAELPKALGKILAGTKPSTDSGALLNSLIERWGGTDRLAADIHQEFQKGAPGGVARQRTFEMLTRLVVQNTTAGLANAKAPSDMSNEELERVAMGFLGRISNAGTPSAETDGPQE